MRLRVLFNWLVSPLNALEGKLITAVAERLSPDAKSLFKAQVEQVNYVQRHAAGKEVNLYRMKGNKPCIDDSLLFPLRQAEAKLATISFGVPGYPKPFQATLYLVAGRFFSIEYSQSPKRVTDSNIEITNVKILLDPMAAGKEPVLEPLMKDTELTGLLKDWATHWKLENLKKPLPGVERDQIIRNLTIGLPVDYLEIVMQTEGLKVQDCVVLGLSEIRSVALPERNYYILAEFEGRGALGVGQEDADHQIWFFDYEGGLPEQLGLFFRGAVESKLSAQG